MKFLIPAIIVTAALSACTVKPNGTVAVKPVAAAKAVHKSNTGHIGKGHCHRHNKQGGYKHCHNH